MYFWFLKLYSRNHFWKFLLNFFGIFSEFFHKCRIFCSLCAHRFEYNSLRNSEIWIFFCQFFGIFQERLFLFALLASSRGRMKIYKFGFFVLWILDWIKIVLKLKSLWTTALIAFFALFYSTKKTKNSFDGVRIDFGKWHQFFQVNTKSFIKYDDFLPNLRPISSAYFILKTTW